MESVDEVGDVDFPFDLSEWMVVDDDINGLTGSSSTPDTSTKCKPPQEKRDRKKICQQNSFGQKQVKQNQISTTGKQPCGIKSKFDQNKNANVTTKSSSCSGSQLKKGTSTVSKTDGSTVSKVSTTANKGNMISTKVATTKVATTKAATTKAATTKASSTPTTNASVATPKVVTTPSSQVATTTDSTVTSSTSKRVSAVSSTSNSTRTQEVKNVSSKPGNKSQCIAVTALKSDGSSSGATTQEKPLTPMKKSIAVQPTNETRKQADDTIELIDKTIAEMSEQSSVDLNKKQVSSDVPPSKTELCNISSNALSFTAEKANLHSSKLSTNPNGQACSKQSYSKKTSNSNPGIQAQGSLAELMGSEEGNFPNYDTEDISDTELFESPVPTNITKKITTKAKSQSKEEEKKVKPAVLTRKGSHISDSLRHKLTGDDRRERSSLRGSKRGFQEPVTNSPERKKLKPSSELDLANKSVLKRNSSSQHTSKIGTNSPAQTTPVPVEKTGKRIVRRFHRSTQTFNLQYRNKLVQSTIQKQCQGTQVNLYEKQHDLKAEAFNPQPLPEYTFSPEVLKIVITYNNFRRRPLLSSASYNYGISFGPVLTSDLDKSSFRDDTLKKADSYNVSFVQKDVGIVELFFDDAEAYSGMMTQIRRMKIGSRHLIVTYCKLAKKKESKDKGPNYYSATVVYDQNFSSTSFLTYYKAPFWSKPKLEENLTIHNLPTGIPLDFVKTIIPDAITMGLDDETLQTTQEDSRCLVGLNRKMDSDALMNLFSQMYVNSRRLVFSKGVVKSENVPEMQEIMKGRKIEKLELEKSSLQKKKTFRSSRDTNENTKPVGGSEIIDVMMQVEDEWPSRMGSDSIKLSQKNNQSTCKIPDSVLSDVSDDLSDVSVDLSDISDISDLNQITKPSSQNASKSDQPKRTMIEEKSKCEVVQPYRQPDSSDASNYSQRRQEDMRNQPVSHAYSRPRSQDPYHDTRMSGGDLFHVKGTQRPLTEEAKKRWADKEKTGSDNARREKTGLNSTRKASKEKIGSGSARKDLVDDTRKSTYDLDKERSEFKSIDRKKSPAVSSKNKADKSKHLVSSLTVRDKLRLRRERLTMELEERKKSERNRKWMTLNKKVTIKDGEERQERLSRDRSLKVGHEVSSAQSRKRSLERRERREPSPFQRKEPSLFQRKEPSPFQRKEPSPFQRKEPSLFQRKEPSPFQRKDLSRFQRKEPSRFQRKEPSPFQRKEPSQFQRKEPSPFQRKEPSTLQRRDPSPFQRRDPSPFQRRDPSPFQRRDPSPFQRRGPSPFQRRDPSPFQGRLFKRSSASPRRGKVAIHMSRSPIQRRVLRRSLSPKRRVTSPMWRARKDSTILSTSIGDELSGGMWLSPGNFSAIEAMSRNRKEGQDDCKSIHPGHSFANERVAGNESPRWRPWPSN